MLHRIRLVTRVHLPLTRLKVRVDHARVVVTLRLLLKVQPLRPTLRKPRVDALRLRDVLSATALQREMLCEAALLRILVVREGVKAEICITNGCVY